MGPPSTSSLALGLGAGLTRWEDERLLRGLGRFTDDIPVAGCLHLVLVRSPWPHARVRGVDRGTAAAMPGVVAVLTAEDAAADGLGAFPCLTRETHPRGSEIAAAPRPLLAQGRVRFVGEPVAAVIATSVQQGLDAAERVEVHYDPMPAVADLALAETGPPVWDGLAGNRAFRIEVGDGDAVSRAFAVADRRVQLDLSISRVIAAPMEPRAAIGFHDRGTGELRLIAGTQSPHLLRAQLARHIFHIPEDTLIVESPDVGGSFGLKNAAYPELAIVLWAARRLGRPVRWLCSRIESFGADDHARDNLWQVELAFDESRRITALRARLRANLGAYLSTFGAHCPLNNLPGLVGPYTIAAAAVIVEGFHTNSPPVSAYRGAGRPEAAYAIERTLDVAARELGIDRIELRRRNLIPPERMPWRSALGPLFDSGNFPENMAMALKAIDWDGYAERQARSAAAGRLRGIGLAHHIESAGSLAEEMAELRFGPSGDATILVGAPPQGQGHETMLRQFVHELLGLDPSRVRILHSATDLIYHGQGTFGSRAASVTSAALTMVRDTILAKASRIAAHLLEASELDIAFADGQFGVVGTDRTIALPEVAQASFRPNSLPPGIEPGLSARHIWRPSALAFPSGCHACELEIDPDTGTILLHDYVAVEDCGVVVNPLLLGGQLHGGIVQGIGQAIMERIVFDGSGQLVSGSFMDYAMPRASDLPRLRHEHNPHPTPTNPLGIKGAGESGTVGALPAVVNAICDALAVRGIDHIDMPASPARIWQALKQRDGVGG